jgi:hypothetical protein
MWSWSSLSRASRAALLGLVLAFGGPLGACSRSYQVGDEVMVEWEGKEYPAVILSQESAAKFKVHFEGYEDSWDEVVPKSRVKGPKTGDEPRVEPPTKVRAKALEAAKTNTYKVGDHVRVEWHGKYYPATVVEIMGKEQYRVHYEGYGPEWDENVGLARVQGR